MLVIAPSMPYLSRERCHTNVVKLLCEWQRQVSTTHRKHEITLDLHRYPYRIARHAGEQGARPASVSQVADEKSTTENNYNNNNIDITSSTLNKH